MTSAFAIPFSEDIMQAPCHRKVKMSNLEHYDGTIDAEEQLMV